MSQTWMFLNHKKCHRGFFMFFTCTSNIITYVYPFTHNNLFLSNHKNALIVFFVSCPLSMLIYMCVHSHIRNCSLLIGHTFKTFFFVGFIVMKPWTSQFQLMSWTWQSLKCDMNFFFHWDENLNVTILINVMTQIFQFNSCDMKFYLFLFIY